MAVKVAKKSLIKLINDKEQAKRKEHEKAQSEYAKKLAAYKAGIERWKKIAVQAIRDATKWDTDKLVEELSNYSSAYITVHVPQLKDTKPSDPGEFDTTRFDADRAFLDIVEDETIQVNTTDRLNFYLR